MTLTRSIFWLFAAEFLFYVSGYVVHLGAGRILGPADYGRYGLVITATLLVANLIGNSIPIAMGKFISEAAVTNPGRIRAIRRVGMILQFAVMGAITVVFFASAPMIASMLGDQTLEPLFRLSAFIIPAFAADAFYFYFYSGIKRFGVQSVLKIARSVLRMTVILGLAYLFSVEGIVAGYILVPLSVFLVAWAIDAFLTKGLLPETSGESFPASRLLRFALPITAFLVLFEIFMSFDLYLVKYLFGSDELAGEYNAALTIARIPTLLFYALTIILLPTIAESFEADWERAKRLVLAALRFMLVLTFPFIALTIAFAEPATTFLFGAKFASASALLSALAVGTGILAILYVLSFAYKGAGRVRVPVLFMMSGIVLNLVFDFAFFPMFGIGAFPVGKLLAVVLLLPFFLASLARVFGVRVDLVAVGKMLVSSLAIYATALFVPGSHFAFLASVPVLLAAYFLLLFLFGVITRDDLALLHRKEMEAR